MEQNAPAPLKHRIKLRRAPDSEGLKKHPGDLRCIQQPLWCWARRVDITLHAPYQLLPHCYWCNENFHGTTKIENAEKQQIEFVQHCLAQCILRRIRVQAA